jgi:AcrR family transcriptional regulator
VRGADRERSSGGPGPGPASADGRIARGERNRDALVEALVSLLEAGETKPTARRIASRAGLSLRTVFAHFDDVESLYAAIAERQRDRFRHLYAPIPADQPLEARIDALVARRAELFESIAPVRRASLHVSAGSPALARNLRQAAAALRRQVESSFAPELARAAAGGPNGPARGRRTAARAPAGDAVTAVDVATGWETWDALRTTHGLSVAATRRVMALLVAGALA